MHMGLTDELWQVAREHLAIDERNCEDDDLYTPTCRMIRAALEAAYRLGQGQRSTTLGELMPFLKPEAELFIEREQTETMAWEPACDDDDLGRVVAYVEVIETTEPIWLPQHELHIVLARRENEI